MVPDLSFKKKSLLSFQSIPTHNLFIIRMSSAVTHSSKTSSTLLHYPPLSTTWNTLFHYEPLSSSSTSIPYSTTHTTTSIYSATFSPGASSPTSAISFGYTAAQSSPTPSPTRTPSSDHPVIPDSEILDPSMGLTVVIGTFLIILIAMTIIIWWTEIHTGKESKGRGHQTHTRSSQIKSPELVGLGITMRPAKEGKRYIRGYERIRAWIFQSIKKAWAIDAMERWTNSAIAILRAELNTDVEKGLLLSVQESERIGREKKQIEFKVEAGRKC